ncbi:PREDICTED: thyrotroph embryonic factor [Polistes canadensis]|uniref:thyrotroph embryonic factor n=1 Tax=Polistes canadensis TaxID=91411 RepID=UPI000718DEDF|nr:PREDICTED: thyrotroph embryonic factor [Polistes canadensis]
MDADRKAMIYKIQQQNLRNYQVPLIKTENPLPIDESMEQPTDLSNSSNQDTSEDTTSEHSILDLSCKKTFVSPTSSKSDNSNAIQRIKEDLPTVREENVTTRKRKYNNSPLERQYSMFTPPSESQSPNINEYEGRPVNLFPINNNNIEKLPSHLPINVPIPIPAIPSILPTLLTSNSLEKNIEKVINTNIQLPTITTATVTPTNLYPVESPRKMPRPFKAYPITIPTNQSDLIYTQNNDEEYQEFREKMLMSVKRQNESSNPKMRRTNKTSSPAVPTSTVDEKDATYWERRKKNNEAAKRSRDARRAKEDEIAIRAAYLEQENLKLKYELAALRNETAKLKCMIYSTT